MRGYIYALVSSSLPNLVKVGMTTKDPEERAREISSATGVPTPYLVGFSVPVADCTAAENYAHQALSQRGSRLSTLRS